jgi:hypothetical protein
MDAAWTSETMVSYTTLHGATTQKTEDGASGDLWSVGILHNPEEPSSRWKPQISEVNYLGGGGGCVEYKTCHDDR